MDELKRIQDLWEEYTKTRKDEQKNELIMQYLPLVKKIVVRMMPNYNNYFELDDLLSVGIFGLVEAIERFDISKNIKFETYAINRIRGKVLDYMRKQDWASVSLRKRIKDISNAFLTLEMQYGRSVSEEEVAEFLDLDVEKVRSTLHKSYIFNSINFESLVYSEDGEKVKLNDIIESAEQDTVFEQIEKKELKEVLGQILSELPENELRVIQLYYFDELMIKEIAQIMELSESRISQIHSKVLGKLKLQLQRRYG